MWKVLVFLSVVLSPGIASAHPAGLPPFADVRVVGDTARTTLSLQPDDTALLLTTSGADVELTEADFNAVASQPAVNAYVASRYKLSIPEGVCTTNVTGGRALERGAGYRLFIDHKCPAEVGDTLTVTNGLLRDLSEDYRLAVTVRKGAAKATATLPGGASELTFDLTRSVTETAEDTAEGSRSLGLARLFDFLDTGSGTGAALIAFGIAFLLGALHGLTPGHGKTLVAAYLAGSDAKARHAVGVGVALTITHTFSVLALGVFALLAGTVIVPARVEPVLKSVAAVMVIAVGVWMLVTRTRAFLSGNPTPGHPHSHEGDEADHPHDHTHHHHHTPTNDTSVRGIVALGLAGGIVPCPEAFGILFFSLTLGRVAAGLFVLIGFSLGLAAVLVAVSLALVASRRALAPKLAASRVARALPIFSALVVTALGIALALA